LGVAKEPNAIDPILRKPTPRQIRHRKGVLGSYNGWIGLLIPHTWIGFFLIYACIINSNLPYWGQYLPATVTNLDKQEFAGRPSYNQYNVRVTYRSGPTNITVSKETYDSLHVGESNRIRIRTLPNLPTFIDPIVIVDGRPKDTGEFGRFILSMTILWNALMFTFIWFGVGINEQLRCRYLTKFGQPAGGHVTGKDIVKGKSRSYFVNYEFVCKGQRDGKTVKSTQSGRMKITAQEYDRITTGESISVLFNPKNTAQSLVYQFDQYLVVE
jgi:hypothetical protein